MNRKIKILITPKFYHPDGSARALQMGKVVNTINEFGCSTHVIAGINKDLYTQCKDVMDRNVTYVPYETSSNSPSILMRFIKML